MSEIISQFSLASLTGSNISYATLASRGWRRVTQRRKTGFRDHGQLDVTACLRQPKVATKALGLFVACLGQPPPDHATSVPPPTPNPVVPSSPITHSYDPPNGGYLPHCARAMLSRSRPKPWGLEPLQPRQTIARRDFRDASPPLRDEIFEIFRDGFRIILHLC